MIELLAMSYKVKNMKKIESTNAPAAIGAYSQAIVSGNLVFVSGQLGLDPGTGELVEGLEKQARQSFQNITNILAKENLTLNNVIKVTVLLSDISDFKKVNEIYAEQFGQPYPARSAYAVKDLPKGGLVEIEVIAEKEK